MRSLLLLALVALIATVSFAQPSAPGPGPRDALMIVGISPNTFVDGEEAVVEVSVAYELVSADLAAVNVLSNELNAQAYSPFADARIRKGSGVIKLTGKIVPRYWTAGAPAKLSAHIVVADDALSPRRLVGVDEVRLAVAKRAGPSETAVKNPNPSVVYEDTIMIKSVMPEDFVEGQETEVVVTVTYELFSREEGEINLGANEGRGNGYSIIGTTRIKMGAGEAVLRARLKPMRTGSLPFAKIFVNLSEYPHRQHWQPLANDSHAVGVAVME
jgi:hypothetical protein